MKLTFHGAAGTVTGSCYELVTSDLHLLVDCGMFQGDGEEQNRRPFPFNPYELDYVLLTHAHIDHSGLIPKLVKEGFAGTVLCTHGTKDLCAILLPDSGRIQESEAEWKIRKGRRLGKADSEPLYTEKDARDSMGCFLGVDYETDIELSDGVSVKFKDAGHILGSSFIEMLVKDGAESTTLTFSGDLGNPGQPIIRDPSPRTPCDILIMESTYGDRLHEDVKGRSERLADIVKSTLDKNGNVIIPSFAVGRTQDLLYELMELLRSKQIPQVPIYIDSPLAISATNIYKAHNECFDAETIAIIDSQPELFDGHLVHFVRDAAASRLLNGVSRSIIIASSGMCEAGRIQHHLKHNLWRSECTILFVGYQAEGTIGRRIVSGDRYIEIMGETITVKARVETIESFSAHADRSGLLKWLGSSDLPKSVILVHGEEDALKALSGSIADEYNIPVDIPMAGTQAFIKGSSIKLDQVLHKVKKTRAEEYALKSLAAQALELSRLIESGELPSESLAHVTEFIGDITALNEKLKSAI